MIATFSQHKKSSIFAANSIHRFVGSTFIWILFSLIVLDFFLMTVRPLQYLKITGLVTADQEPLNDKLENLYSSIKKPDFLVLGSSLPMCACVGADWEFFGKPSWTINFCERYTGSRYLDKQLSKSFTSRLTGYDLGMPACMISDDYAILRDTYDHGLHPKMIILAIAPRDFLDNSAPPVEGSRYYKFLESRKLGPQVSVNKSLSENTNEVLQQFWRYFKVRADYKNTIEFIVCSLLGRASSFSYALEGKHFHRDMLSKVKIDLNTQLLSDAKPSQKVENSLDLAIYKKRYLPFNEQRLQQELAYLEKLLALCRSQNTVAVVINMPVHPANRALLPKAEKTRVSNSIAESCRKNQAFFLDYCAESSPEDPFGARDFSDSVHLRPPAAKKLVEKLASDLNQEKDFLNALRQPSAKQQLAGANY